MPKVNRQKKRVRTVVLGKPRPAARKSETTRLGSALRALGGLGGSALGSLIGMPSSGASVGTGLGASLSRWLGSGDYEVQRNSIVNSLQMSGSVPEMHKSDQTIVVRHREFITTVQSSINYTVQSSFDINPGNPSLFPWLSGIAARFQEYKIRGMVFHYVPTSGASVSSTNAALGAVMLQTTYRASEAAPASKVEILNEYASSESVPSSAFCHPIECDPKENPFNIQYVRSVNTTTSEDKLLYDLGTTHLAVQGSQTNGNALGDLWVTYEIELKKPLVSSNIVGALSTFAATYTSPTTTNLFTNLSSSIGSLGITATANVLTFPKGRVGQYMVTVLMTSDVQTYSWASPTIANGFAMAVAPGASTILTTKSGTTDGLSNPANICGVEILDPSVQCTLTYPAPTMTGTWTGVRVIISRFSPTT